LGTVVIVVTLPIDIVLIDYCQVNELANLVLEYTESRMLHSYLDVKVLNARTANCCVEDPEFIVRVGNGSLVAGADRIACDIPNITAG
jgi:hypothetical protein